MLIWVLKCRGGKMIWGLIFLFPQQSMFNLKIAGGRKRTLEYLGFLKKLV